MLHKIRIFQIYKHFKMFNQFHCWNFLIYWDRHHSLLLPILTVLMKFKYEVKNNFSMKASSRTFNTIYYGAFPLCVNGDLFDWFIFCYWENNSNWHCFWHLYWKTLPSIYISRYVIQPSYIRDWVFRKISFTLCGGHRVNVFCMRKERKYLNFLYRNFTAYSPKKRAMKIKVIRHSFPTSHPSKCSWII